MKIIIKLPYFTSLFIVLFVLSPFACGGGSETTGGDGDTGNEITTTLTVSSVKDSSQQDFSDGSTLSGVATLTVAFSEPMDEQSVSADTVALTCNGQAKDAQISARSDDTDDITGNEFLASFPILTYNEACTLTIAGGSSGVKASDGKTMTSDHSLPFTVGCVGNDEFDNADTFTACWEAVSASQIETFDINTSNAGSLTMGKVAAGTFGPFNDTSPIIYKEISGNFTVDLYISSSNNNELSEAVGLIVYSENTSSDSFEVTMRTRIGGGFQPAPFVGLKEYNDGSQTDLSYPSYSGSSVYLRITRSGNTFAAYYSNDGSTFSEIYTNYERADLGDPLRVGIFMENGETGTATNHTALLDYIRFGSQ